jgi:ubiquitin-protein ligase E3 B
LSFKPEYVQFFYGILKKVYNLDHKVIFESEDTDTLMALEIFSISYLKHIQLIDDTEFMNSDSARLFTMDEVKHLSNFLNHILFTLHSSANLPPRIKLIVSHLTTDLNELVRELYKRDKQNSLWEKDFWLLVPSMGETDPNQIQARINPNILANTPHMCEFIDRARIFSLLAKKDLHINYLPGYEEGKIVISRQVLYQDAFDKIIEMREEFKGDYRIQFIDETGQPEEGIDGGGLMKEFIQEVLKAAVSDIYGFFLENSID